MSFYTTRIKVKNKRDGQKIHAIRRAIQRYDTEVKIDEIIRMIQRGEARFLKKESNRLSHFRIIYKGKEMDCVYDRRRKMVVTFLTPKHREKTV